MQVEEVIIRFEWGHIAGKWWGPRDVRPIVLLHGWQDNAGSFARLIRLLPPALSYFAIDFPGFGHSSHPADGTLYGITNFAYILDSMRAKFKWKRLSLIGHSMGSIVAFIYAGTFPKRVDLLVSISLLQPLVHSVQTIIDYMRIKGAALLQADPLFNGQPPVFTFRELVDRVVSGSKGSVHSSKAVYLIRRSVRPSDGQPGKFYLLRNIRAQNVYGDYFSDDLCVELAKQIGVPHLFLKTNYFEFEGSQNTIKMIELLSDLNPRFEWQDIKGTHHVHLNQPDKVSGLISTFLLKYYRRFETCSSISCSKL